MTRTIRTIGQASRHGMMVKVECRHCERAANFFASDLAGIYGEGRGISSLRFACSVCASTDSKAIPYEPDLSRTPEMIVWRPTKVKAS